MKNIKYSICAISIICSMLFLSGCASQDNGELSAEESSGELVPVGEISALPLEIQNTAWFYADQADLYYEEIEWNKDIKVLINRIYRWNREKDSPKLIFENTDTDNTIYTVFADDSGNLYFYGYLSEDSIIHYYLKKISTDGSVVWQVIMDYDTMGILEGQNMQGGVVDANGQICLYDRYGKLYLFNEQGELKKKADAQTGSLGGIVRTRNGVVFGYLFERIQDRTFESLVFFSIDMNTGAIGSKMSCTVEGEFDVKEVWCGPQNQLYAIYDNSLCEIDVTSGERREVCSFDGEYVNIEGSQIQAVTVLKDGRPVVYLYDDLDQASEYAVISQCDMDTLPKKETITIGIARNSSEKRFEYYVRRFNRRSKLWRVEAVYYYKDRYDGGNMVDQFSLDVLNGNAPDIIDVGILPIELLDKKELFENLEPYFADSKIVNKEDLLESVWRAGFRKEGMYSVMPWFWMQTSAVKKDKLKDAPWNLETLIKLSEEYPDSNMLNNMTGYKSLRLLYYALEANRDMFYDIESGTCNFTDTSFLSLLEAIRKVEKNSTFPPAMDSIEWTRQFLEDELIVYEVMLDAMTYYQQLNNDFQDSATWVGFPSAQEQYNVFYIHVMLSINSSSRHKDGAWEFLEYLLSEEQQKWTDQEFRAFPVRKDGFDYYIKASPLLGRDMSAEYATEEEINALYKMVDNTYADPTVVYDRANNIIVSESLDYFLGDKSVEETAAIIQNRVELYLAEQNH